MYKEPWTNHQVGILIEEYEKRPVLYNPRNPHYTNRNLRNKATNEIVEIMKHVRPYTSCDDLTNKYRGLRSSFASECMKISESQKTAKKPEDVYTPSLWYFYKLRYLKDFIKTKVSFKNLFDNTDEKCLNNENEDLNDYDTSKPDYYDSENNFTGYDTVSIKSELELSESDCSISNKYNSKRKEKSNELNSSNEDISTDKKTSTVDILWTKLLFSRLDQISDEYIKLDLQKKIDDLIYDSLKK